MRRLHLALLLSLALPGCAAPSEEVLPIAASIRGASRIAAIETIIRPTAKAAVASLDEQLAAAAKPGSAPFVAMLEAKVRAAAADMGLTGGRPLKLILEIDAVAAPDSVTALLGDRDRLAGTVFVRDPNSGEALGQLYVDVVNTNPGLIGLVTRGSDVRTALAEEFALHVARALSGGRSRR